MPLDDNMAVEAKTVNRIFRTLEDFVNWLSKAYPKHLNAIDAISHLKEVIHSIHSSELILYFIKLTSDS